MSAAAHHPPLQRHSTLAQGHEFDDVQLDFDPWVGKLQSMSSEQLANFVNKKAQESKDKKSEQLIAHTEDSNIVQDKLNVILSKEQGRQAKIEEMQQKFAAMEQKNIQIKKDIDELKEQIGKSENLLKEEEEGVQKLKGHLFSFQVKFDISTIKKVNDYLAKNSEIPIINIIEFFTGLLRNDTEISPLDVELIFKNYAAFSLKLKSADPNATSRNVFEHWQHKIEVYKTFIHRGAKDACELAKDVDFDGVNRRNMNLSKAEAEILIQKQIKCIGTWAHFVGWSDAFCQLSKRSYGANKIRKSIEGKQARIQEMEKEFEQNNIIAENMKKENLMEYLQKEGQDERESLQIIQKSQDELSNYSKHLANYFHAYERNFFHFAHEKQAAKKSAKIHSPAKGAAPAKK